MKTPGVYIQELDAFGNSVVPVATAVPAFIGFTEEISFNGKSLVNEPIKVTSLAEYYAKFGSGAPKTKFSLETLMEGIAFEKLLTESKEANAKLDAAKQAKTDATNPTPEDKAKLQKDIDDAQATVDRLGASISAESGNAGLQDIKTAQENLEKEQAKDAPDPAKVKDLQEKLVEAQTAYDAKIKNPDFESQGYACNLKQETVNNRMYAALKFFYENGGGDCYVVSTGKYSADAAITDITPFQDALTKLKKETEPTMLVIPDIMEIQDLNQTDRTQPDYLEKRYANAYSLQGQMISHCGDQMNRVAILDIPGGFEDPDGDWAAIKQFRTSVSADAKYLSYAAAYYPWLHTTVYQSSEISYENIQEESYENVYNLLISEFTDDDGNISADHKEIAGAFGSGTNKTEFDIEEADKVLKNLSSSYSLLINDIQARMNLMGPSAGMAGIYTTVDNSEGVWQAPANIGIQSTIAPALKIDHNAQQDLNMPLSGKAVCAIRTFPGRGNLVWGARTLDGNSNDWRYVNVRRTLIYIEQSVKEAAKAYVFAPNDASTWVNVKSMISNFLIGLWNQGGLVGPKPADAFSVSVGLGSTMTGDDVLNGIMRVMVKVAVSRPAEFIEITFQQQMQKA